MLHGYTDAEQNIGRQRPPDSEVRKLLTTVISQCRESRLQIADEMSLHAGQRISKRMLDDWTAESKKPARFPACFVQAFCEVTEDDRLQRRLLSERLRRLLEVGENVEKLLNSGGRKKLGLRAKR